MAYDWGLRPTKHGLAALCQQRAGTQQQHSPLGGKGHRLSRSECLSHGPAAPSWVSLDGNLISLASSVLTCRRGTYPLCCADVPEDRKCGG